MNGSLLAVSLRRFFTNHLANLSGASIHTIASYRDAFRLLFRFASEQLRCEPAELRIEDIDADLVGRFLGFVESGRKNSIRSRNARLSAIRSFFRHVAAHEPQLMDHCQRILAIPFKKYERSVPAWLDDAESNALVAAPDTTTRLGRRDRTLLLVAVQTGLRVSELINLSRDDVVLGTGAHVRCMGKGRKERATPLRKDSAAALTAWLAEQPGEGADPVFPSNLGGRLSRDAVECIVRKHASNAAANCPSLKEKRVTPHVLRHAAAMSLLHTGIDYTIISLWLGHESVESTQIYIHADLRLKEQAMERTRPTDVPPGRYKPPDDVMAFLDSL